MLPQDLGLPDAQGIDVLRQVRSSGERFDPDPPVLVLSGRASDADRVRGFEAGADDYLAKPSSYPELWRGSPTCRAGSTAIGNATNGSASPS